jgi:hypothetical protein
MKKKKVDLKALKAAKKHKLAELQRANAVKVRETTKRQVPQAMLPPPPRVVPLSKPNPQPSSALPAGFFDEASLTGVAVHSTSKESVLTPQLFDRDETETVKRDSSASEQKEDINRKALGRLVDYGSDNEDDTKNDPGPDERTTTSSYHPDYQVQSDIVKLGDTASQSALPAGFFDENTADMKARGIEPESLRKANNEREIEEFFRFAETVGAEAGDNEADAEATASEESKRAELEQMLYMNRLAPLLTKVSDPTHNGNNGRKIGDRKAVATEGLPLGISKGEVVDSNSAAAVGFDSAELQPESEESGVMGEISSLLARRKKKKKRAYKAAFEDDYTPLDPLAWRAKGI